MSRLIPSPNLDEEEEKKDWKAEKGEWEKLIKCPHCSHQLKRKKLKKHIANIHPALFVDKPGDSNNTSTGATSRGFNRSFLPKPKMLGPNPSRTPIPSHVKEHITQMMQCDPWKTKCDFCPYIGNNLSRHMLTHTEEGKRILKDEREEILSCTYCNYMCKKKNLRKHIKNEHPHMIGQDMDGEETNVPDNSYSNNHFNNFNPMPTSDSQKLRWGNAPIPDVTASLDLLKTPYKNNYGSFTSGEIFQQDKPNPSNGANPNRSMNNNFNQKPNSFRPPVPGENNSYGGGGNSHGGGGNSHGGGGNSHGGGGNSFGGGGNSFGGGGFHEQNNTPTSNHQGGFPDGSQGAYQKSNLGGNQERNGPNGSYNDYSSGYGSQYSGGNTSSETHNDGTPSVGPDYGYGYGGGNAPWDAPAYGGNEGYKGGQPQGGSYGWSQGW